MSKTKGIKDVHPNVHSADTRTRAANTYTAQHKYAAEDEIGDFIASLTLLIKPRRALELGTLFGHTAEKIGKAMQQNGLGHLDTIEIDPERAEQARERLAGLPVTVHTANWHSWRPDDGTEYDLAFFDGGLRATRHLEYLKFREYLSETAALLFHDTGDQHHKTKPAMDKLKNQYGLQFVFLQCPRGLTIANPA